MNLQNKRTDRGKEGGAFEVKSHALFTELYSAAHNV